MAAATRLDVVSDGSWPFARTGDAIVQRTTIPRSTPRKTRTRTLMGVRELADVARHHKVELGGIEPPSISP